MTCSAHFNIQSEESISQLWNTVGESGASGRLKQFYFFHGPMINYIELILKTLERMKSSYELFVLEHKLHNEKR